MNLITSESDKIIRQLFQNHFHHLSLFAFNYTHDFSQAEEIVQDVFVKLWQNFSNIKDRTNLKAYLYKAVKNSCLNYIRHRKTQQKYQSRIDQSDLIVVNPAENNLIQEETRDKIHRAVNKLPDHWKEAIILSKYDRLKYREIASMMGVSQKTVEKYISKALQFLRQELIDIICLLVFFFSGMN